MIQDFVDRFMARRDELRAQLSKEHPENYESIVRAVVSVIGDQDKYERPDPERIHTIDDGDYQGTLLFIIASRGYQPDTYWFVKVSYGSCSVCDTLEAIRGYRDTPPDEQQVADYMTLALHIVQGIKELGGDAA